MTTTTLGAAASGSSEQEDDEPTSVLRVPQSHPFVDLGWRTRLAASSL